MASGETRASGVQSLQRAAAILTTVARRGPIGLGLAEISRRTTLPHGTARRILASLIDARLICQDEQTRRYTTGPLLYELGASSPHQSQLIRQARPALERLAAETGDTVYLVARSGLDAVCLERIEGSHPIRVVTMGIGERRPLGLGAAGLAILAALDDSEIVSVLRDNRAEYETFGRELADVRASIETARSLGYAPTDGLLTPGVAGIGMVILSAAKIPVAGISIASVSARIFSDRTDQLVGSLKQCVNEVMGNR